MTLIRKLALCISNKVIRYASPGSKEWAEGLAREVAFVEGDWAAVGWALGSARILFDYREAPIGSLADLAAAAKKFAEFKRKANANIVWLSMFVFAFISGDKLFHATNWPWPQRLGSCFQITSMVVMAIISLTERRKRRKIPSDDNITALIQFYATELKRQSNFESSPWGWNGIFAATFYFVGLVLSNWGWVRTHPVLNTFFGLLWMGLLLRILWIRRTNRRRLEQLDALFAGNFE